MASSLIQQREAEEACRLATDALAVVVHTEFAMGLACLRRVRRQLALWESTGAVQDFDEQLRAVA